MFADFRCLSGRLPILLLIMLPLLLGGCTKEMSAEGPAAGTVAEIAVFTFIPVGVSCSDAATSGTFKAGKTLTADAVLKVTVNVTQKGTWQLTTTKANDFQFSGSGTFTATGAQVMILHAKGSPLAAGFNVFPLKYGTAECAAFVVVTP